MDYFLRKSLSKYMMNQMDFIFMHVMWQKYLGNNKGIAAQPQLLNLFAFFGGWGETHRATDFICL
jgi:hypothetical protein